MSTNLGNFKLTINWFCLHMDSTIPSFDQYMITLKLRKPWTLKIFLECVFWPITRDLVTAENEWVLSHGIELFRKTRQGLIFTSLSYRNWKCYSFLFESPTHTARENRFERFCRIKFFDKPAQRSVFPTFQIKPTQAAVISPWSNNCNVLSPNSPLTACTADSIYLGRIIRAFKPGLHHITCSCIFWKWHIFKFSNGTPGCWRITNAAFDSLRSLLQCSRN